MTSGSCDNATRGAIRRRVRRRSDNNRWDRVKRIVPSAPYLGKKVGVFAGFCKYRS
jgi:hypothetical protein